MNFKKNILTILFQTYITVIITFVFSCSKQDAKINNTLPRDSVKTITLAENQKKVLAGAKKCLEAKFSYDMDMAYHVLKYKDGVLTGFAVYPMGDLDPSIGVCTDVTIRTLRWGGVCDLQKEIHEDIISNRSDYPMKRWGAKNHDANIDHRRVPNQLVWFKKNWIEVTDSLLLSNRGGGWGVGSYQPGDVVVWDMNDDSWADHIGIISDNPTPALPKGEGEIDSQGKGGVFPVIHNFPSPGYVAEEDVLNRWKILGVYRVK